MIRLSGYKNKTVGVFGLGKAGTAAVKSLLLGGATVYAWDDSDEARRIFSLDLEVLRHGHMGLEPIDNWPWAELDAMVLSPGVPLHHPEPHPCVLMANDAKVPIKGEVDLLYEACPEARYIGVTGTNGKSTTTALIAHIFRTAGRLVQIGANFGVPALGLKPLDGKGWYVLEMSSYQLDLTKEVFFDASILLNISPDHIDRHGSLEEYVKAKASIFDRQRDKDVSLVGLDDGHCRDLYIDLVREHRPHLIPVSVSQVLDKGVHVTERGLLWDRYDQKEEKSFDLRRAAGLQGRHNWQNVAAAYGVARHFGIAPETIMEAVFAFPGLPHRLERITMVNQISFYNDSKATNAEATAKALDPFEKIYWIAGGRMKDGGITSLEPYFGKIKHAFLMGEAEDAFAQTLEGKVAYTKCKDLENATLKAAQMAMQDMHAGSVVLFSPACASFDQWKNFEVRGEAFRKFVRDFAGHARSS